LEDRRTMQNDSTAQAAAIVLASLARNHPEAVRGQAFTLEWNEAQQAGLDQDRFDAAMWWLIEYELLERDEEAENLLGNIPALTEYEYGLAFKITKRGRELLQEAGADDPS
jgi:hypothetical protein